MNKVYLMTVPGVRGDKIFRGHSDSLHQHLCFERGLTIATLNVNGLLSHHDEIQLLLRHNDIRISLINETKLDHSYSIQLTRMNVFEHEGTDRTCLEYIAYYINQMLANSTFPDKLKLADALLIFHFEDSTLKKNFVPIRVLSAISKIFERLISKQSCLFAYRLLSNLLCACREEHSPEHALFRLTDMCHKALVDRRVDGMALMDLSKAYEYIPHDLLIARLAVYVFGHCSLVLIHSYLSNRKKEVKVGSKFSEWQKIKSWVPQGSVLGPHLYFSVFS